MKTDKHTPGKWDKIVHGPRDSRVGASTLIAIVYSTAFGDRENQEANARLIGASTDMLETLRADAEWLRHYLANNVISVQSKDERGYVMNSFAAVQIPDWAVKQRLDDIDAALKLATEQPE